MISGLVPKIDIIFMRYAMMTNGTKRVKNQKVPKKNIGWPTDKVGSKSYKKLLNNERTFSPKVKRSSNQGIAMKMRNDYYTGPS